MALFNFVTRAGRWRKSQIKGGSKSLSGKRGGLIRKILSGKRRCWFEADIYPWELQLNYTILRNFLPPENVFIRTTLLLQNYDSFPCHVPFDYSTFFAQQMHSWCILRQQRYFKQEPLGSRKHNLPSNLVNLRPVLSFRISHAVFQSCSRRSEWEVREVLLKVRKRSSPVNSVVRGELVFAPRPPVIISDAKLTPRLRRCNSIFYVERI